MMFIASLFKALTVVAKRLRRSMCAASTIHRNRQALNQLDSLDAHLLADIGLKRRDLSVAAAEPFYCDPMQIDPFKGRRRLLPAEIDLMARMRASGAPEQKTVKVSKKLLPSTGTGATCKV